jgi:hypothetical protein
MQLSDDCHNWCPTGQLLRLLLLLFTAVARLPAAIAELFTFSSSPAMLLCCLVSVVALRRSPTDS